MADQKRAAKGGGVAIALILSGIYAVEGGYVHDGRDPGGATNMGVTETVARHHGFHGDMRNFPKHCDGPKPVCADEIYVADYIEKPGYITLVEIEPAVADKMVDTSVNMGPGKPNSWFREALGITPSQSALRSSDISAYEMLQAKLGATPACETMLSYLSRRQEAEYNRLVNANHTLKVFLKGWIARARDQHPGHIPCKGFQQ